MKNSVFIFLSLVLISFTDKIDQGLENYTHSGKKEKLETDSVSAERTKHTAIVTTTMYYPVTGQCDSDPLTTAGMYKINPSKATEHKWIAMSRNLLKRWGGDFDYGDYVLIEGAGNKDGIYMVADTMNKRYKNRIDILETTGTDLYKFENVRVTKIESSREIIAQNL